VIGADTEAYRLVHGEGDGMPGLVVDRYGAWAVMRLDGRAIESWRDRILGVARPRLAALGVENLLSRRGRGEAKRVEAVWGRAPEGLVTVREHGMALPVDLVRGQKTGLFLDHRDSRRRVRELAAGQSVLNLYAYTGGFSIAAGLGGARSVTTVDVAPGAIELAREGWAANGLDPGSHEACAVDARSFLERAAAEGRRWTSIVADPPSFAPNEASRPKALRAYKAMHRGVLEVLSPGGLYLAASCSSHVDREAFETTLREAAHGVRRPLQILGRWGAGADHPVRMGFPEGDYLTVTLARAID
jgi:23S rRNA (cytosine1962-C5)-methyltransferase